MLVTDRPILFSGPMVRAIIEGRKTQTRRIAQLVLDGEETPTGSWAGYEPDRDQGWGRVRPGDLLWVREAFTVAEVEGGGVGVPHLVYDADGWHRGPAGCTEPDPDKAVPWAAGKVMRWGRHPSIHMPRWASRLILRVEAVRSERVQALTEADAAAEGMSDDLAGWSRGFAESRVQQFARGWDAINGRRASWESDPVVFVLTFRREEATQCS